MSLAATTAAIAALEALTGIPNASAVYLVAVVVAAYLTGTAGAIAVAVGSFLLYNFLFTEPRLTLTIADPDVWLSVVLLLFIGVVVGQLAAVQRARTEMALDANARRGPSFVSAWVLATRTSTPAVLGEIASVVRAAAMERVWIALGSSHATERVGADTGEGRAPGPAIVSVLRRMPGDEPARWIRVHQPTPRSARGSGLEAFRVRIEAHDASLGSIWALRRRRPVPPDRTATRLLAAAADQLGQALAQDRPRAEAEAAEIARRSDELKTALLQQARRRPATQARSSWSRARRLARRRRRGPSARRWASNGR
jgi:two-component system sensor histidine kinase KdpD